MYDPPAYIWVAIIGSAVAVPAVACAVLYGGAVRAGLGRKRAALLAAGAAVLTGGWTAATAVIASHGWYAGQLAKDPWLPVAAMGFFGTLVALSRIPVVARALKAPGTRPRLVLPHIFRIEGVVFLIYLASGHLPALFALPAGLGDMATGFTAPLVARKLARGGGRRAAVWFNAFGLTDIVTAVVTGTAAGLLALTPSSAPIAELPLVLIPTAMVPLLAAMHIASLRTLPKPLPSAAAPVTAGVTSGAAAASRSR